MRRRIASRVKTSLLLSFGLHGSCQAAGGTFSAPGLAFFLLHLPLLASTILVINILVDARIRKLLKAQLWFFLIYVAGTILLWAGVLNDQLPKSFGGLVLVLMFLAPWPVFIFLLRSYMGAGRNEP